jgi:mRNA interferase RelE/StbE
MDSYKVEFKKSAKKALDHLPSMIRNQLALKIYSLKEVPRPDGCKKLKGEIDLYRIRVGDYRIVYLIQDGKLIVIVVKIGHRRDVYRD